MTLILSSNDSSSNVIAEVSQHSEIPDRISYSCTRERCMVVYHGATTLASINEAEEWYDQIHSQLLSMYDEQRDTLYRDTLGHLIIESKLPFAITSFCFGKLKLTYEAPVNESVIDLLKRPAYIEKKVRLLSMQFFSLDEWLNGFDQAVTMTLERIP